MSTGAVTYRLFFALWPDEATRAALQQSALLLRKQHPTPGRWINPLRYHLTLHFLGDYPLPPDAWARKAMDAADKLRVPPFQLSMDQAGSFRNREVPWWIGPSQTPDELRHLWRELRDVLRDGGVPYDTGLRLTPHLTVVRNAERTLPVRPLPVVHWQVQDFVLIESRLGPGAQYRVLARWPLQAGPPREPGRAGQLDLWDNPPPTGPAG